MQTPRLGFSHWKPENIDRAVGLWGDPQVTRFISSGGITPAQIETRLRFEIDHERQYGVQYWPVFRTATGEFAGCCGLRTYDSEPGDLGEGVYELGFHLCSSCWGKGYAREAAEAVIAYGFKTLKLKAIFAGHHPDNTASARLLEKLGFRFTGHRFYPPTGLEHPAYLLENPDRSQRTGLPGKG